MPKYKLSLSEPVRQFRDFGDLTDGAIVDSAEQPPDGVTWTWAVATADDIKQAKAAADAAAAAEADPSATTPPAPAPPVVVPDPPVVVDPATVA